MQLPVTGESVELILSASLCSQLGSSLSPPAFSALLQTRYVINHLIAQRKRIKCWLRRLHTVEISRTVLLVCWVIEGRCGTQKLEIHRKCCTNILFSRYDAECHNCYSFVLEFLNKLSRKNYSKEQFCEQFITPGTMRAGQYVSIFRKITHDGFYCH